MNAVASLSQFQGIGGAIIVSFIAFTIVFGVLAGLSAIICVVRYVAMIIENDTPAPKASAPAATPAPVAVSAASDKDMKKVVAAISAALLASTGKNMRIISVTPANSNCSPMNQMWRAAGIMDCLESRLGSRSW